MARFILLALFGAGCSLVTVQQPPFPPLEVRARRPPPVEAPPPPPKVVVTETNITIADKVQFATGSADILPVSFGLLDDVAKVFVDHPNIQMVEIQGHTDSTGAAGLNRTLSQQRAESVMHYLVGKGVAAYRMTAKGFGPDKPIADNATEDGRDKNRRVEFNIVKQGGGK
jgi:outer membrane protein OmpA-like peptidoglycan-associated protein